MMPPQAPCNPGRRRQAKSGGPDHILAILPWNQGECKTVAV